MVFRTIFLNLQINLFIIIIWVVSLMYPEFDYKLKKSTLIV